MKPGKTIVFSLALALACCSEPKREQATEEMDQTHDEMTHDVENAERAADAAAADVRDEAAEDREQFTARVNKQIDKNKLDIEELKNESRNVKREVRSDYERAIADLEARNEKLRARLNDGRNETGEAWNEFKTEFNRDMDELGNSINNMFKKDKTKTDK